MKENVKEFSASYSDDVNGEDIYIEVCQLKQVHKANINSSDEVVKPLDLLNKPKKLKLNYLFPNICVTLRIFLTLPVTVASGERSFSKLVYVKNKLRNSSTQDRMVALSLLSIESELAREIDFNDTPEYTRCVC